MATMSIHPSHDWCHLCGHRSTPLIDIWFPEHASSRNTKRGRENSRYIRICAECIDAMQQALMPPPVDHIQWTGDNRKDH